MIRLIEGRACPPLEGRKFTKEEISSRKKRLLVRLKEKLDSGFSPVFFVVSFLDGGYEKFSIFIENFRRGIYESRRKTPCKKARGQ